MTALAPDGVVTLEPTGTGPLDGLRVVVKDLYDVAGRVTAAGNPTLASGPPAVAHATAVARVLAAGGRIVGKTATDELAMGMFGVNSHFGTPANPAAPDRVPGGSSSGSASAVAAGDADLGLGTDTGGSIRVPAAFCGLVGLRTTHGRVPLDGVRPMAPDFDTVGLLGRTVAPVAAGFDALVPVVHPPRVVRRLLLLTDLVDRAAPEAAARTRDAAAAWAAALGLELVEAPLLAGPPGSAVSQQPNPTDERLPAHRHPATVPGSGEPATESTPRTVAGSPPGPPADLLPVFWPLMSRQLWQSNGAWVTEQHPVLGEGIEARILAAADITDEQVATAQAHQDTLEQHLTTLLADAVAVLPTTIDAAPRRDLPHAALMAYRDRNLAFVVPASLAGAPQLSLPTGTVDGAPVGTSLLGLPDDDELLLELASVVAR